MTIVHVCTTCRAGQPVLDDQPCAGQRLYTAMMAQPLPPGVTIRPVECLSACDHGCTVAISRAGAWSYVYGRLAEADAPAILHGAAQHAGTDDGLVPWRERPEIFRKQSLARLPPVEG